MKKHILAGLVLLTTFTVKSQDFLGYSSSNYNGITGVINNPANVVDSRMRFDMTLAGLNMGVGNNYLGVKRMAFNHSGKAFSKDAYYPAFADPNFNNNYLHEVVNDKEKAVYMNLRVNGPSFLINLNGKNAIGFTSSSRTFMNVDGITSDLARLMFYDIGRGTGGAQVSSLLNQNLEIPHMSANVMSWLEYGLTYGHVFRDKDEHFFKMGVTAKFLQGLASAYANTKNFKYKFNDTLLDVSGDFNYGHSSNIEIPTSKAPNKNTNIYINDPTLNSSVLSGYPKFTSFPGFGLDIGFVYEYRPDYEKYKYEMDGEKNLWRKDKNKYKLKIGASLIDLGSIKYAKGPNSNNFSVSTYSVQYRKIPTDSAYPVYGFDKNVLDTIFHVKYNNTKGTYNVNLPTQLSFQIDYNIWKDIYVNLTPNIAFQFKNKEAKVHEWTTISLTPRWDHKWFGVSIPVSYSAFYAKSDQPIGVGLGIRLGPLVIGSNRVLTYLSDKQDVYGADLYAMLKLPIIYKAPKDRDKDKVSDKKDKCKTVPGVWEFMGCPDRDGDHIQDSEDKCPDVPGLTEMLGCPDRDGDGITDAEDDCPDDKGPIEFKGCPDRDGDKIIDKLDSCVDVPGLPEFNGCPDKDGDGTPDKTDVCPDIPGPKEYKGCPDRDGDGTLDKDDACPDVAGPKENKGCPWPDSDKDGIIDKDDACPTVPGVKEFKGCPPPPPMKAAEQKILERAFAALEFATAKDIIKPKSYPSLNDLAKLLVQHQNDWTLKLSGHTDNDGTAEKNMVLSEKRANAVKNYLVKKGAKPDKIMTEWFGQTQPIADNTTPKGKQKNRRVEMKILFKEPAK